MPQTGKINLISQALALAGLLAVLQLHLLSALLAGLLVYQLVQLMLPVLSRMGIMPSLGKKIAPLVVALFVVALVSLLTIALLPKFSGAPDSIAVLLQKMADIVEKLRSYLPEWTLEYINLTNGEWQKLVSNWLRHNAEGVSKIGHDIGLTFIHIILGMVIGGMVAFSHEQTAPPRAPLSGALVERVDLLSKAFRNIVFSQVRISGLNTILTGFFLAVILPLSGNGLPFTKTMIAITFVVGLLPVIGNLISNSIICLIALHVSLETAIFCLVFLVVIHKLEYFLNARIIGSRIHSRAWEILVVMLVMEAAFGIAGIIAAPIYYAYLKDELSRQELI
ncbi:MAG: AI-2E family transporter [Alphaproteobacteria bacterium]